MSKDRYEQVAGTIEIPERRSTERRSLQGMWWAFPNEPRGRRASDTRGPLRTRLLNKLLNRLSPRRRRRNQDSPLKEHFLAKLYRERFPNHTQDQLEEYLAAERRRRNQG